ncbi:MAG: T9SS type A sorting domain-containing protein [Ignavibacteriae bacterium]|nr:T9SS type A sorting domain-containing protein [Ignavibacteriota bacterium]
MKRVHSNVVIIMIFVLSVWGSGEIKSKSTSSRKKDVSQVAGTPRATLVNINNISMWVGDDGRMERRPQDDNSGVTFPRGTATAVYAGGLVWAGKVSDSSSVILRVGGQTYNYGTVPGRIVSKGVAESPSDSTVRIYRVRRDWNTADLSKDAAELYDVKYDSVTQAMIDGVREQYKKDWLEWPWQKGAPYYDRNYNGVYDPETSAVYNSSKDEPGCANADQVVWFVANDLRASATSGLYGSPPIGIEMQVTCWAYNRTDQLANVIFQRYRLIYKGTATTPSNAKIDSMYLAKWSDPDLGNYGDDYAGCNVPLSLGYVYNAQASDNEYQKFGLPPPAIGYDLLQGPIVPYSGLTARFDFGYRQGFTNLPMTSFAYFAAGGYDSDPTLGQYAGTLQWWNLIRGFRPRPITPEEPHIDPTTNQPTKYTLSGDPITLRGWIDGRRDSPSDRRIVLASGPFTMALGDTQEVVVALIGGKGFDHLNSVSVLKSNDEAVQYFYDFMFSTPFSTIPTASARTVFSLGQPTIVKVQANVDTTSVQSVGVIIKQYNGFYVASGQLYDDGLHDDENAGDHIYGNSILVNQQEEGLYMNLNVSYNDNSSYTWQHVADDITTAGPLTVAAGNIVSDNINGDGVANPGENIRYLLTFQNASSVNLSNLRVSPSWEPRYRILTVPEVENNSSYSMVYNLNDDSSYFILNVPPDYDSSMLSMDVIIRDDKRNVWRQTFSFPVQDIPFRIFSSPQVHTQGTGAWAFDVRVVNPSDVKDHEYLISIVDSIDTLSNQGFNLTDISEGRDLLLNQPFPDDIGHGTPAIDGFKLFRGKNWGRKGGLSHDSTRWISDFPQWIQGSGHFLGPYAVFNFGVAPGFSVSSYIARINSVFDTTNNYIVEVKFDSTQKQKAYRLRQAGTGRGFIIQPETSFTEVPFSVWDHRVHFGKRQLTMAWFDFRNDGLWQHFEPIFIYDEEYDSTGTNQFSMPPNAIEEELTVGSKATIMYILSLRTITGHVQNESPGTLVIYPYQALTSDDRFVFNPTVVGIQENAQPSEFKLHQNYPNPFNPVTTIAFELPNRSVVSLKIYNILGQLVANIVDQKEFEVGQHQIPFDATNFASGVYFYKLEVSHGNNVSKPESFVSIKKMLIIK